MALADAKAAAVVFYPCNEASGDILDGIGASDLTETGGTIASAAGHLGNARDFEAGDTEYGESADTADLSVGDILWFATLWVNAETLSNFPVFIRKGATGAATREYVGYVDTGDSNKVAFSASNGSTEAVAKTSAISTATASLICLRHNPTANTIGVSLNGGAFADVAHSGGIQDLTGTFQLGAGSDQNLYWDGLIEQVVIGKDYEFTDDDATALWNGGDGVAFDDWDGGEAGLAPNLLRSNLLVSPLLGGSV